MPKVTNFPNGLGVGGTPVDASRGYAICYMPISFDPTSATQVLLGTLPAGATPIDVIGRGGATGGTNPTVVIGTGADDDGYANELDADAAGTSATSGAKLGALIGTRITTPTAVYGKVGASAASGGTFVGGVVYIMTDA